MRSLRLPLGLHCADHFNQRAKAFETKPSCFSRGGGWPRQIGPVQRDELRMSIWQLDDQLVARGRVQVANYLELLPVQGMI